jgi:hypothetical protein
LRSSPPSRGGRRLLCRTRGAPSDSETAPDLFDSSVIFSLPDSTSAVGPVGRPPDPFWAGDAPEESMAVHGGNP